MEPYSYAQLEYSDSIRLIHIDISESDELSCQLKQLRLDKNDPPKYSALSYVWGQGSFSTLVCNGKAMSITTTLEEALRQVTKHNPNEWIWIDQICIDLADDKERSQQVWMMNLIYEKAETVLGWIGPERSDTAIAVDLIQRVAEIAMPLAEDTFQNEDSSYREALESVEEVTVEKSEELGISFDEEAQWQAFRSFFDRPWYERIWVVQEILPARNAFLLCGQHAVPWDSVKYAATWYHWKASAVAKNLPEPDVDGIKSTVSMNLRWSVRLGSEFFRDPTDHKERPSYKWDLLNLLNTFRSRLATEPKDKLYALLGLSANNEDPLLQPDYSKSMMEIFRDATIAVINGPLKFDGNLDVLRWAVPHSDEPGWPSWVADWRITDISDVGIPLTGFRASYPAKYRPLQSPNANTLRVEGILIGRAKYISRHTHASEITEHMREEYDKCCEFLSSYPTGEDLLTVFGLTLIRNQMQEDSVEAGANLVEHARNLIPLATAARMPYSTVEERAQRLEAVERVMEKGGYTYDFTLRPSYCERRLFVTDSGYMGIGDYHMVEGDVIAILIGLQVACVLRPLSEDPADGYAFVGEAYCHGVMYGELVKSLPKGEDGVFHGDQEFLIR
jgi:Heterokaryon incompatibility protein (HET)